MRDINFMSFIVFFLSMFQISTSSAQGQQMSVENGLRPKVLIAGEVNNRSNILQRLKDYKIQGVSIAVINNGQVEWSHGYGHISNDPKSPQIDEKTLFQAGSISKTFTAFGALLLVQQGKLSLDEDVNLYLKRWKVPGNEFTTTEKVTLRRLLSHTAGMSVSGFPGYSTLKTIPTIVDILQGKKPHVNTDPVIVISKPGTEYKYSGGGTTIVQLLIEDVTGEHFDTWMQNNVLKPLGMLESTFAQPLPERLAAIAAFGHHLNGAQVDGKWHVYPEMAAAGLWSTPKDLAQIILYIQSALKDEKTNLLNSFYVKEMITRQKTGDKYTDSGLGVFLEHEGKDLVFSHAGQDEGFIARLLGFAYLGKGVVIMMNNDSGWALIGEITNSIADTYTWQNFEPIEKKTISLEPSSLTSYPGQYVNGEDNLEVSLKDNKLYLDFKNGMAPMVLYPSAKCTFFIQHDDLTFEFQNCDGNPGSLIQTDPKGVKTTFHKKMR